jgi:multicomponent Na+:H+ antiporter subunit D
MGCIALRLGSVELTAMRGLGRRMPLTMAAFVLGGLSLIGVPLTVGFISKWYLVLAILERGWWPLAFLVLLGSLLAVIYIWRVVEAAYFQQPDEERAEIREAPVWMQVPMWILIGASLYFGIFTSMTAGVAQRAAAALLGGTL